MCLFFMFYDIMDIVKIYLYNKKERDESVQIFKIKYKINGKIKVIECFKYVFDDLIKNIMNNGGKIIKIEERKKKMNYQKK